MNHRNADVLRSIITGNAGIPWTPLKPAYQEVVPEIMVRPMDSFVTGESSSQVRYVNKIADEDGKSYDALTLPRQAVHNW